MTEWVGNVDWIQVAGFMITLVLFLGVVFGGFAYYNSSQRKVHTAESDSLVRTRGQRIDDLEDELERVKAANAASEKALLERIQNQQGQIDMLREMKTEEIIVGVREGLKDEIKDILQEILKNGR